MAKDMHEEEWDSATLTKLEVFEEYVYEWLNVTVNYAKNNLKFDTLEIYDLFCGSGFDVSMTHKGSPLRILDAVLKRNLKGKQIKLYFNDIEESKINALKMYIKQKYEQLDSKNIIINYTATDIQDYKLLSKKYYKLIFLDQYGIKHVGKIEEFLTKGVDMLMFISSGHVRRFLKDDSFKNYIDSSHILTKDFEGKSNYETHRVITEYVRKKFNHAFVSPFSLIKDNGNINGLIFISTHQKGQEQFLKTAWKIDNDFGEGNKNIDHDFTRDDGSLFCDRNQPSEKEKRYIELLKDFLQEERTNLEIKRFSLDNGFLPKHTNNILTNLNLECEHYNGAKRGFHLDADGEKVKIRLKF